MARHRGSETLFLTKNCPRQSTTSKLQFIRSASSEGLSFVTFSMIPCCIPTFSIRLTHRIGCPTSLCGGSLLHFGATCGKLPPSPACLGVLLDGKGREADCVSDI